MWLSEVYEIFMEAKGANRWDDERKCFVDPQGNLIVDPNMVYLKRLLQLFQLQEIRENPNYKKEMEDGIKR
ncbi:hypothetical protein Hanom_Chr14g01257121 [Helianthus anomalus]